MVYGLPAWGDTPTDPHSSFTHVGNYPIDGGLVDGPVYTTIFSKLIGIELHHDDAYAPFQSGLAVYHDDYGDFSTNEPTMDGTATLIYLLAAKQAEAGVHNSNSKLTVTRGAIVRGDSSVKKIALVFTGDEFGDGLSFITKTLSQQHVKASFFFTGRFYANDLFKPHIKQLHQDGHYLSTHSDQHLLYCDWEKRDSLLVSQDQFEKDMRESLHKLKLAGIDSSAIHYYIPPYEWWNDTIAQWSKKIGLQVINFTPGTKSNTDYTYPGMKSYQSSEKIWQSIQDFEKTRPGKMNGFILLMHAGTDPKRKDKFYEKLDVLIQYLKKRGYRFERVDDLLEGS